MTEELMNDTACEPVEKLTDVAEKPDTSGDALPDAFEAEDTAERESEETEADEPLALEVELEELKSEYPELISRRKTTSPERYAELRALGLSKKEAYLATSEEIYARDGRAHLKDTTPSAAKRPVFGMSRKEMESARTLFTGLSDREIWQLYKKVTK